MNEVVIPDAAGLSPRNLKYCQDFFCLYSPKGILPQVVADFGQQLADSDDTAIGLLVCRGKNAPLAKYLLGKIDMPIGVSDYELLRKVPDDFKSQLPTVEEIEAELANMEKGGAV